MLWKLEHQTHPRFSRIINQNLEPSTLLCNATCLKPSPNTMQHTLHLWWKAQNATAVPLATATAVASQRSPSPFGVRQKRRADCRAQNQRQICSTFDYYQKFADLIQVILAHWNQFISHLPLFPIYRRFLWVIMLYISVPEACLLYWAEKRDQSALPRTTSLKDENI